MIPITIKRIDEKIHGYRLLLLVTAYEIHT